MDNDNKTADAPRRKLLKSLAAGGGALGLTGLPSEWARPIVASVILPAHAQTSPRAGCGGTLDNCPPEDRISYNDSMSTSKYLFPGDVPPGVSVVDGTMTGSFSTSMSSPGPPCPSPCDDLNASKYGEAMFEAGGGSVAMTVQYGYDCGDDAVARGQFAFNGTGSEGTYTGQLATSYEGCNYLGGSIGIGTLGGGRGRRRQFNFGDGFNFGG